MTFFYKNVYVEKKTEEFHFGLSMFVFVVVGFGFMFGHRTRHIELKTHVSWPMHSSSSLPCP